MSSKGKKPAGKQQRSAIADVVAREYTIHLHKRVRQHHHRPPSRTSGEEGTGEFWKNLG